MIIKPLRFVAAFALAATVLVLAGCADKSNPDNVDRRSVERWDALIARDAAKAFDYLSPGYQATQSREKYADSMNNRPVQWKSAKFRSKKCDADRCKVIVDVTYLLRMPGAGTGTTTTTTPQVETWILVKGEWYFLPK